MTKKRKILLISGSTKKGSTNNQILQFIALRYRNTFEFHFLDDIESFPFFNTDLNGDFEPQIIQDFKKSVKLADAVIISTPEYVFSIPGILKNAIEWAVSSVAFTNKPLGIIVAAASGQKALEYLELIMTTIQCQIAPQGKLLIQGAKGKLNEEGELTDPIILRELDLLIQTL
jgi:chromate reductase, NAD(P)H dehydrogenase (quinone)